MYIQDAAPERGRIARQLDKIKKRCSSFSSVHHVYVHKTADSPPDHLVPPSSPSNWKKLRQVLQRAYSPTPRKSKGFLSGLQSLSTPSSPECRDRRPAKKDRRRVIQSVYGLFSSPLANRHSRGGQTRDGQTSDPLIEVDLVRGEVITRPAPVVRPNVVQSCYIPDYNEVSVTSKFVSDTKPDLPDDTDSAVSCTGSDESHSELPFQRCSPQSNLPRGGNLTPTTPRSNLSIFQQHAPRSISTSNHNNAPTAVHRTNPYHTLQRTSSTTETSSSSSVQRSMQSSSTLPRRPLSSSVSSPPEPVSRPHPKHHPPYDRRGRVQSHPSATPPTSQWIKSSSQGHHEEEKSSSSLSFCTLPRRSNNGSTSTLVIRTVVFHKGPGHKGLGFSVVGGKDSPKGSLGIYVRRVLPSGQAAEGALLREGDEIFTVNSRTLEGLSHQEAVKVFKEIKQGRVVLQVGRRVVRKKATPTKQQHDVTNHVTMRRCKPQVS